MILSMANFVKHKIEISNPNFLVSVIVWDQLVFISHKLYEDDISVIFERFACVKCVRIARLLANVKCLTDVKILANF